MNRGRKDSARHPSLERGTGMQLIDLILCLLPVGEMNLQTVEGILHALNNGRKEKLKPIDVGVALSAELSLPHPRLAVKEMLGVKLYYRPSSLRNQETQSEDPATTSSDNEGNKGMTGTNGGTTNWEEKSRNLERELTTSQQVLEKLTNDYNSIKTQLASLQQKSAASARAEYDRGNADAQSELRPQLDAAQRKLGGATAKITELEEALRKVRGASAGVTSADRGPALPPNPRINGDGKAWWTLGYGRPQVMATLRSRRFRGVLAFVILCLIGWAIWKWDIIPLPSFDTPVAQQGADAGLPPAPKVKSKTKARAAIERDLNW